MIVILWTDKIEDAWWESDMVGDVEAWLGQFGGALDGSGQYEMIIFDKDEDATAFTLRFG